MIPWFICWRCTVHHLINYWRGRVHKYRNLLLPWMLCAVHGESWWPQNPQSKISMKTNNHANSESVKYMNETTFGDFCLRDFFYVVMTVKQMGAIHCCLTLPCEIQEGNARINWRNSSGRKWQSHITWCVVCPDRQRDQSFQCNLLLVCVWKYCPWRLNANIVDSNMLSLI